MARKTINITEETWRRLQATATPFASTDRGTPDKAIAALLDEVDKRRRPPADRIVRAVLEAVAEWEPVGTSIGLEQIDRVRLREQITDRLADALDIDPEGATNRMLALRMVGTVTRGDQA